MSTDDLTEALRIAGQARGFTVPSSRERALVVLADEVDRLRADSERYHAQYVEAVDTAVHAGLERDAARAEADRYRTLWDRHGKNDLLAERDAARAALERVRADVETVGHRDDTGTYVDIEALTRALEGES